MLQLVRLALEAVVLWLRLKQVQAGYELQRRIDDDIAKDEAEIRGFAEQRRDMAITTMPIQMPPEPGVQVI